MNVGKTTVSRILLGIALLLAGAGLVYAQTGGLYNLTWHTIDSGGDTDLSGGEYTLFSTIGQPEAQATMHSGGRYVLLDGFWPSVQASSICPSGADLSFSPTNPDPGQAANFSGWITSGNGVITFTWNFGDNSDQTFGQNLNHTFVSNNVYTVVMSASGDQGCIPPPNVSTATANITVGFGIPTALVYLPAIVQDSSGAALPTSAENAADDRPSAVRGLWGMIATDRAGIIMGWTANPQGEAVEGYHLYRRARNSDGVFIRLATVPVTSTTFADTSAACGYIYYVTAFKQAGESPPSPAAYFAPACP